MNPVLEIAYDTGDFSSPLSFFVLTAKNSIMKCFDKFGVELKEGDIVDVQNCGEHKIYKKEDGELYFMPYGVEEKVGDYFSNDMVKVE